MRNLSRLIFTLMLCCICGGVFADSTTVQNNVIILHDATAATCKAAANGQSGPSDDTSYSGAGEFTGTTGPGIRSCSGCAVNAANDCVCSSCSYYFN